MAAVEQFLTAMFELRPSRRKAAILERVRSIAEDVFWSTLETHREIAEQAVSASREDRSKAIRLIETAALVNATAAGLTEPVAQGVTRDISGAAASYNGPRAPSFKVTILSAPLPPFHPLPQPKNMMPHGMNSTALSKDRWHDPSPWPACGTR